MPLLFFIAALIFALVAFGVSNDDINLLALGLTFLAAGHCVPDGWLRRGQ